MIGIGGQRFTRDHGTESSTDGSPVGAASSVPGDPSSDPSSSVLPSLEDLRFQAPGRAVVASVLDNVLYGLSREDGARKDPRAQDVRRDIVETAVTIVATAAVRDPEVLDGPDDPHGVDRGPSNWPDRFGQLLASVRPVDHGPAATSDIVAQCAGAPAAMAKLVAVMGATVGDRLSYDGRPRDVVMRAHLVNAAVYADIAWCASHGDLVGCASWRSERQDKSERLILTELKRHLPPEADGRRLPGTATTPRQVGAASPSVSRPIAAPSSSALGLPGSRPAAGLPGTTAPRSTASGSSTSGPVGPPASGLAGTTALGTTTPGTTAADTADTGAASSSDPAATAADTGSGTATATPTTATANVPHPTPPTDEETAAAAGDPRSPGTDHSSPADRAAEPASAGARSTTPSSSEADGAVASSGDAQSAAAATETDSLDDWALAAVALTHDPVTDDATGSPTPSPRTDSATPSPRTGPAAAEPAAADPVSEQARPTDPAVAEPASGAIHSAGPAATGSLTAPATRRDAATDRRSTIDDGSGDRTEGVAPVGPDAGPMADPESTSSGSDDPTESSPLDALSGGAPASGVGITLPPAIVDLVGRLLSDGRWPSPLQRDIAERTRSTIDDLRNG